MEPQPTECSGPELTARGSLCQVYVTRDRFCVTHTRQFKLNALTHIAQQWLLTH